RVRRGSTEKSGLSANRRVCARRDQRVEVTWQWNAYCRVGKPGQPSRCRCPIPAKPWPQGLSVRRVSSDLRPRGAASWKGCRDATSPRLRRAIRSDDGSRAPPFGAYLQTLKWCDVSELTRRAVDKFPPKLRSTSPLQAATPGFQSPGPVPADDRC